MFSKNYVLYTWSVLFFILHDTTIGTEYQWSANIRYRLKTDTSSDVLPGNSSSFSEMRSRMGLDLLGDRVSGHFILQDSRILGASENSAGITNTTVSAFFHQAYFTFKTQRQEYKVGRFELPLGNQRIIAKNNWNNIGRSFEGILVKRKNRFGDSRLFILPIVETKDTYHNDLKDNTLSGIYWTIPMTNLNEGSAIEPYIINYQDSLSQFSYNLFGARADLKKGQFNLEGEYALQNSSSISADLLSVNLGFRFKNIDWLNSLTLGTDQVSGDDLGTEIMEGFSKYFGARHKHHGYYDYKMHKKYFGHSHEGLKEYNLKGKFNFFKNTNLLIAYHDFSSNIGNIKYGQELDIIFKRKLVEELSSEFGVAFYAPNNSEETLSFYYFMITASL